ncbi:hypothetical protein [Aquamicrobium sp. LC103]|nr:hypothetical protein [Aquamicrobium sp. LC103]
MTSLDRFMWQVTDSLASLPVFPTLIMCACLGAALIVGAAEGMPR